MKRNKMRIQVQEIGNKKYKYVILMNAFEFVATEIM